MAERISFGICAANLDAYARPDNMRKAARLAEDAGFESIWAVEHVALPDPRTSQSPMEPTECVLDPIVSLVFIAASTQRIRLGTGVLILPQRNPVTVAKQLASLDVLSGGRLILGIGLGYVPEEFTSLGIPFEHRGARADEYLHAMTALWDEAHPAFHGRFVSFEGIQSYPRPIQRPHPPVVVGGRSPAAFQRTVQKAQGWYGYGLTLDEAAHYLAMLREAEQRFERPENLGPIQITVTPDNMVDLDTAKRFADLGVHRLNIDLPSDPSDAALKRFFDHAHSTLIGQV